MRQALLLISLCVAVSACRTKTSTPTPKPLQDAPKQRVPGEVMDSASPAGAQLTWLMELVNDPNREIKTDELERHFAPLFLKQMPVPELANLLTKVRLQLKSLEAKELLIEHTYDLTLLTHSQAGEKWVVSIAVSRQAPFLIEGLFFQPAPKEKLPEPESFAQLDERMGKLAATARAQVSRINVSTGACEPVHELDASSNMPLASTFKLYVLLAMARAVDAKELGWDDTLRISEDFKSLPSGTMHQEEAGVGFTHGAFADKMISVSDNTATDHLMHTLGQERLAAAVKVSGHHSPDVLSPMLSTQQLFKLKLIATPAQRDDYAARDVAGREAFVEEVLKPMRAVTLPDAVAWDGPRDIATLEWFGSAKDICALHATFVTHAEQPAYARALKSMSLNDAGIALDGWPYVGYKGGAEPGVLTMSWLVKSSSGQWFSVMLGLTDTVRGIDERELVGLGRAAVKLIPQDLQ